MCICVTLVLCHYECKNHIAHSRNTYLWTQNWSPSIAPSLKVKVSWCSARIRSVIVCTTTPVYAHRSTQHANMKARVVQLDEAAIMCTHKFSHAVKVLRSRCAMDYPLALKQKLMECNAQGEYTCGRSWVLWAFCCHGTKNHFYSDFWSACRLWLSHEIDYYNLVP